MRNRISQYRQLTPINHSAAAADSRLAISERPTLRLGENQSIVVDMERFFDLTFSFAEALIDLEDRYGVTSTPKSQLHSREQSIRENSATLRQDFDPQDFDFEIDARWM